MKIAIIGINFFPEVTGCAPYTTDMANEISKAGHAISVYCGRPHYPQWKVANEFKFKVFKTKLVNGYKVNYLWHYIPRTYTTLGRIAYEITFAAHLLFRVYRKKFDLVIVISPSLLSILAGIWLKRKGSVLKVLVQDLISAASRAQTNKTAGFIYKITRSLEALLLQKADTVGVISESFQEVLVSYGINPQRFFLSENYSLVEFRGLNHKVEKAKWGWNKNKKIVIYTGNFGIKQNLLNLVKAAEILENVNPEIHIVLVGDGNQKREIASRANGLGNVTIRDLVPQQEYSSLVMSADLLLLHEGANDEPMSLPSKLETYLASSRPILAVCSLRSSTFELVSKHSLPHCIPESPEDLAEAIRSSLNSKREPMSKESIQVKKRKRIEWAIETE